MMPLPHEGPAPKNYNQTIILDPQENVTQKNKKQSKLPNNPKTIFEKHLAAILMIFIGLFMISGLFLAILIVLVFLIFLVFLVPPRVPKAPKDQKNKKKQKFQNNFWSEPLPGPKFNQTFLFFFVFLVPPRVPEVPKNQTNQKKTKIPKQFLVRIFARTKIQSGIF